MKSRIKKTLIAVIQLGSGVDGAEAEAEALKLVRFDCRGAHDEQEGRQKKQKKTIKLEARHEC